MSRFARAKGRGEMAKGQITERSSTLTTLVGFKDSDKL